jgi:putative SOS response-associated peptidase YedK
MCGRFTRANDFSSDRADHRAFLEQLGLASAIVLPPSYNIAPTQQIAAVRSGERHRRGNCCLREFRLRVGPAACS